MSVAFTRIHLLACVLVRARVCVCVCVCARVCVCVRACACAHAAILHMHSTFQEHKLYRAPPHPGELTPSFPLITTNFPPVTHFCGFPSHILFFTPHTPPHPHSLTAPFPPSCASTATTTLSHIPSPSPHLNSPLPTHPLLT